MNTSSLFTVFTNTLRIFGFIKIKHDESFVEKLVSAFHLYFVLSLFIWCLIKVENPFLFQKDNVAAYCQLIYHISVFSCIIAVFLEAVIFPKYLTNLLKILAKIDEIMIKDLKIQINYKTCKMISYVSASPNIIVIFTIITRIINTDLKLFEYTYYLGLASATFIFGVMESFYNALALQIFWRFNKIENSLKSQKSFKTELINDIFMKAFNLIEEINDNFGFFILAAIGKVKLN